MAQNLKSTLTLHGVCCYSNYFVARSFLFESYFHLRTNSFVLTSVKAPRQLYFCLAFQMERQTGYLLFDYPRVN